MTLHTDKSTFYTIIGFIVVWLDTIARNYIRIKAMYDAGVQVAQSPTIRPYQSTHSQQQQQIYKTSNSLRRRRRRRRQLQFNYINQLPNEILQLVLEQSGTPADWFHCTMVCQRWHQLVTPLLWKVPILPSPSYDHRQTTLVTFFRALRLPKYGHAIHTLTLDHTKTDNDNRHFIAIMQHCPNLKVLDFADALTTKGYHYLARAPCAPGLTCLMLTNDESLTDDILITLAMRCRSLQRIELVGCRRITQRGIQALVARQQQLICLNLKDCNQVSGQILQDLGRLCGDSLVSLDVTRIGAILHSDLQALVGFCPRLEYLALGRPRSPLVCQLQYRIRMEQDKSRRTMARSKSSTPISRSSRNKNNNKAESVMSLLEQHESILSYSSRDQVSHATVEMILSELTCLKSLDLTHWTCLTDPLLGRKQMKYPSSCR